MAIPTVGQIMPVLLQALGDRKEHYMDELIGTVCDRLSLTMEERNRVMPKGVTYVYDRTHHARTRLKKLGLLAQPERAGPVSITGEGERKLAGRPGPGSIRLPYGGDSPRRTRPANTAGRATRTAGGATVTAAVAVWVAAATLHRKYGNDRTFTTRQIRDMVERQDICRVTKGTISSHISKYCVANKSAGAEKHRKLYNVRRGAYRLYRKGDGYHADREGGPEEPDPVDVPADYEDLLEWYADVYCGERRPQGGRDLAVVLDSSVIIPWLKKNSNLGDSIQKWLDGNKDKVVVTAKTANELYLEDKKWDDSQRQEIRGLAGFKTEVRGYTRQKVDVLQKSLRDNPAGKQAEDWIKRKRKDLFRKDRNMLEKMGFADADSVRPYMMSGEDKTACLHRLFDSATQDRDLVAQCVKLAEDKLVVLLARDNDFEAFPVSKSASPHPEKSCVLVLVYSTAIVVGYAADGSLAAASGLADADGAFSEEELRRLYEIESALRE